MEPVFFPYDVRRDITFYGLQITKIWIPIVGLIGASLLLLVDVPFLPIMLKLLLIFLVPAALFIFFVFDVEQWIQKIKAFINEPQLRLPDSRGTEKSVQCLVDAKARPGGGPFLDYKDGYVGVILSVHPLPWACMPEDEKALEIAAFRTALKRALGNKVYVSIYTEFDVELPRVEIEKKALEWRTRFPVGSPLRDLAEARLRKFNAARSIKPISHIRLLWKPTNRDLPRKPGDEKERNSLINEAYSAVIETFIRNLYSGGINCKIFGAEAARDIVSRQLNPADWRRVAPVSNTCWESRLAFQQKQESRFQDKVTEIDTEKKIGNNINLAVIVTFEKGAATKQVTLTITKKLLELGYSVSLVDADIHSPGVLNAELGMDDLSADWRTMPGAGNAAAPAKGLMYWGLSNNVYSIELSRTALWRVIDEARKWSHAQIVHLGQNESALPLLAGKAKVIAVTGQKSPDLKMPLKFSHAGTILVAENDELAKVSARNYRARKCYILEKDMDFLIDHIVGGTND